MPDTQHLDLMQHVDIVRSKNAGPFWVTVDIFCKNTAAFQQLSDALETQKVADRLALDLAGAGTR